MANGKELDYLFEASWEVANKVGGIYTVVSSKAQYSMKLARKYLMFGPYIEEKSKQEFVERTPPAMYRRAMSYMKQRGINVHYGHWQIPGEPEVMLIDYSNLWEKKNEIKAWLWENFGIDSLFAGQDFEEPIIWAWATGMLIEQLVKHLKIDGEKIIAHFHEWLSGAALLYLKKHDPRVRTVFTTHATMLGRTLAGGGVLLYEELEKINPDEEAKKHGIQAKHLTEKACALNATIFSTVSDITGREAERFFGRKPEAILPNGLDMSRYPTLEETTLLHVKSREAIREFISYYFFPYYTFDLRHNLIFFISGRYEYRNKGIDITIKALARLNEELKKEKSRRTITTFFFVPLGVKGIRVELLENKNKYDTISNFVEWHEKDILERVKASIISGKNLVRTPIFSKEFLVEAKKHMLGFKREGNPPICTHYLINENEKIIQDLYALGLDNKPDDPVKVIVYPVYLSENDGLLGMPYYHVIAGSHLGIFPSYYEPWGYTPLESATMGTPAVTSDMAGFGKYLLEKQRDTGTIGKGIYVVKRDEKTDDEAIDDLFRILKRFASLTHPQRVHERLSAKTLSELFDWSQLILYYEGAYKKALS